MLPPTPKPPGPFMTNAPVEELVLVTLPNSVTLPAYKLPYDMLASDQLMVVLGSVVRVSNRVHALVLWLRTNPVCAYTLEV